MNAGSIKYLARIHGTDKNNPEIRPLLQLLWWMTVLKGYQEASHDILQRDCKSLIANPNPNINGLIGFTE